MLDKPSSPILPAGARVGKGGRSYAHAIAYRLDSNGTYQRYVPGRTGLSSMGNLNKYDSLLVLITESGARCVGMPIEP